MQVNNIGKDIPITPDSLGDSEHIYKLYIWIQDTDDKQDKLQELNIQATLRVDAKQGLTSE